MSDYANVDEAVRDLIDRVSAYRRADLGAYINGAFGLEHLVYTDLRASIYKIYRRWVGLNIYMLLLQEPVDFLIFQRLLQ
jgi:5-formaminoimidazole-4-carboxamide-1-beta-D-ribofuranosyl 5'-monophosphate synthetase